MKAQITKEGLKVVGHYGVRLGKTVVIEGCKAVIFNTAKTVAVTGFEEGLDSVKELKWNDFLSDKEARVYKKAKKAEQVKSLKDEIAKLKKGDKKEKVVETAKVEKKVTK